MLETWNKLDTVMVRSHLIRQQWSLEGTLTKANREYSYSYPRIETILNF